MTVKIKKDLPLKYFKQLLPGANQTSIQDKLTPQPPLLIKYKRGGGRKSYSDRVNPGQGVS